MGVSVGVAGRKATRQMGYALELGACQGQNRREWQRPNPVLHLTAAAVADCRVQAPRAAAAGERVRYAAWRNDRNGNFIANTGRSTERLPSMPSSCRDGAVATVR